MVALASLAEEVAHESGASSSRCSAARQPLGRWRARAAAGDAGDRVPLQPSPDGVRGPSARISPGPEGHGYVEGENVAIVYRWAENQIDRLPALAADLVRRQVAVIAATGATAAAFAAKAATTTIPIVFASRRPGQARSCRQPRPAGRQLDRDQFFRVELAAKRLELLRELVPAAARVAVLVNPANAAIAETTLRDVKPAARAMGLQIQVLNASTSREINAAFATFVRERPDALLVGPTPFSSPACAIGPSGGAPRDPRGISGA